MKNFFLKTCISTHLLAKDLIKKENIESTSVALGIDENKMIKILSNEEDFFITSEKMTNGVTTKDNVSWFSPRGNLYLTMVFCKKNLLKKNGNILTNFEIISSASFVLYKFIKQFIKNIKIKWPNDLIVLGASDVSCALNGALNGALDKIDKKICGIMSENLKNYIIVSAAFNIEKFPKKTSNFQATSIYNEKILTKKQVLTLKDTKNISSNIFRDIQGIFSKIINNEKFFDKILSFYIKNMYKLNQEVNIQFTQDGKQKVEKFTLISISKDGEITLKNNDKMHILNSCEILYNSIK